MNNIVAKQGIKVMCFAIFKLWLIGYVSIDMKIFSYVIDTCIVKM